MIMNIGWNNNSLLHLRWGLFASWWVAKKLSDELFCFLRFISSAIYWPYFECSFYESRRLLRLLKQLLYVCPVKILVPLILAWKSIFTLMYNFKLLLKLKFLKTSKRKYFCFALMLTIAMHFDMPHYLHEFHIKTQQWLCSGASLTYVVIAILGKHFVWKLLDNILHACSFKRLFFAIIFIRFMYKRPMTMSNKKHDYRLFWLFLPWNTMVAVFSLLMCCM